MPKVTVTVIMSNKRLSNATIKSKREGDLEFKSHGLTDVNGKCVIEHLPGDTYVFAAEPPIRGAGNLRTPAKKVPPISELTLTVRMGPGCYYVVRRLRTLINKQEYEKAEWLIASVRESYADYREHPVLSRIDEFQKEIPARSPGTSRFDDVA